MPLKYIRAQKDPRGKLARWILELENIDYSIECIKCKYNVEADYLSRIETECSTSDCKTTSENPYAVYWSSNLPDIQKIKEEQEADPHIADAKKKIKDSGKVVKGIYKTYQNLVVNEEVLHKGGRIVVPKALVPGLLREYHGQYHHGMENTLLTIKQRFYWRYMKKDVERFVGACQTCTQCKDNTIQHSKMKIPDTVNCRDRLCIDIACMPKSTQGNSYFLQMIDFDTKFAATSALSDQEAETIKKVLWPKWFAYFGIPSAILSYQGSNVDGKIIRKFCEKLNIQKMHSSLYHPEGNGSTA